MCCTSQHKLSNHPTRLVWASRLWQLIIVLLETIALLENSVNTATSATAIKWNSNIYTAAESTVMVRGKYAKLEPPTVNCCYN
jgi:hypothetical protein